MCPAGTPAMPENGSTRQRYRNRQRLLLAAALLIMLAANAVFLRWPFSRRFDPLNTQAAIQAYAHIGYGFSATRGGNIFELLPYAPGPIPPGRHYVSRPPLFNYLYLPGFWWFGKQDRTVRLTNILLTVPAAWLLWRVLVRYCGRGPVAPAAFVAWCLLPSTLALRQVAIPENITLITALYMFLLYPRWQRRPLPGDTLRLAGAAVLGALLNYDGILPPLVLLLSEAWRRRWRTAGLLAAILALQAAVVLLFATYLLVVVDVPPAALIAKFTGRSLSGLTLSLLATGATLFTRWHWFNLNPVGLILLAFGILRLWRTGVNARSRQLAGLLALTYGLYAVIFANAFLVHSYIVLQSSTLCALLLGLGFVPLLRRWRLAAKALAMLWLAANVWFWHQEFARGGLDRSLRFAAVAHTQADEQTYVLTNRNLSQLHDTWYLERWYADLIRTGAGLEQALAARPASCTAVLFVHDIIPGRETPDPELDAALATTLAGHHLTVTETEGFRLYRLPPSASSAMTRGRRAEAESPE